MGTLQKVNLFDTILFMMITGYLLYRLWSVLGYSTPADEERQKAQAEKRSQQEKTAQDILEIQDAKEIQEHETSLLSLKAGPQAGLIQLQSMDPQFRLDLFLERAEKAYRMILEAFTKADRDTLMTLLTRRVFDDFEAALRARQSAGETLEIIVETIDKVEIDAIRIEEPYANIVVRFRSGQIRTRQNAEGEVVENPAKIKKTVTEQWQFTRSLSSANPTWYLSSTEG